LALYGCLRRVQRMRWPQRHGICHGCWFRGVQALYNLARGAVQTVLYRFLVSLNGCADVFVAVLA